MTDLSALPSLPFDLRTKTLLAYLDRRRAEAAVAPSDQPGVWEVFGYDEHVRVLGDHRTFSNDMNAQIPEDERELTRASQGNFIGLDPPLHTRMRELVRPVFTPAVVAGLKPVIAQTAEELLDGVEMSADGTGAVDLAAGFAAPLAARVIAKLFGIPEEDHGLFGVWADAMTATRQPGELGKVDETAIRELGDLVRSASGYLLGLIHERRAHPRDDLISALVRAEVDGHSLDDHTIVGVIGMFVIAGHLPSSLLIGNMVMALDTHPAVAAEVRDDPGLLPRVVEEVLRWRPPIARDLRITTCDTELGGERIPAGSMVSLWIASAHRDAFRFDRPAEFDIHRESRTLHVAFGKGIHYCIGAPLARLEATIALSAVLRRFGHIEVLHDGVEFHPSVDVLGPVRLPTTVRRTPTR